MSPVRGAHRIQQCLVIVLSSVSKIYQLSYRTDIRTNTVIEGNMILRCYGYHGLSAVVNLTVEVEWIS